MHLFKLFCKCIWMQNRRKNDQNMFWMVAKGFVVNRNQVNSRLQHKKRQLCCLFFVVFADICWCVWAMCVSVCVGVWSHLTWHLPGYCWRHCTLSVYSRMTQMYRHATSGSLMQETLLMFRMVSFSFSRFLSSWIIDLINPAEIKHFHG